MNHELHNKLVAALLKVPDIEDFDTRTSLMIGIPNRLSLPRSHSNTRTDISQLVDSLSELYLSNGTWALSIFIDNAVSHLDGTRDGAQLKELLRELEASKEQAGSLPTAGRSGAQHPVISSRASENFPTTPYPGGKQTEVNRGPSRDREIAIEQTALRKAILRDFRSKADLRVLCADVTQIMRDQGITDLVITL